MGKRKRERKAVEAEEPPEGCHHYEVLQEVPWDIQKYFGQRYSIWSRYSEGIWMTDDAWFGVTPEPVADKVAVHLADAAPASKPILIDPFAGAGGNVIAFARSGKWKRVYAIEKDPKVLACAKHNARLYGVDNLISWYEGDCFEILKTELVGILEFAVVFASPPWGGPGYRSDEVFNLSQMEPYNLEFLAKSFQPFTKDIALYLPRNSDLRQLARYQEGEKKITIMHYCMEGASKAICAYFGDLQLS